MTNLSQLIGVFKFECPFWNSNIKQILDTSSWNNPLWNSNLKRTLAASSSSIMYEIAKEIRKIVTLDKTINPCDHRTVTSVLLDQKFSIYIQVNNYEIVVNFIHTSHNLTWYSAIVHKATRIYPFCSTNELIKQFM